MNRVVFARIGWMKRYRGPQADDEKPIGGGSYNKSELGHEAFNFLPCDGEMLGYFQPRLRQGHPSRIALERIEPGFQGAKLDRVLVIFVATDPARGGQRIVGWYRDATVYRDDLPSNVKDRKRFSFFVKAKAEKALLIPEPQRVHVIPGGKGAFGQANVCYALETDGKPKNAAWIEAALDYVGTYKLENIALEPESESDRDIEDIVSVAIERGGGFQSNPRIRRAIEDYAMRRAKAHLEKLGYKPKDKHTRESYDFLCDVNGTELYVEVKGMQDNGESVSLTPKEVEHARNHFNSALFIVHSVRVEGKRKPVASHGQELFVHPWDLAAGTLKPRGFVYTLSESQMNRKSST